MIQDKQQQNKTNLRTSQSAWNEETKKCFDQIEMHQADEESSGLNHNPCILTCHLWLWTTYVFLRHQLQLSLFFQQQE